MIALWAYHWQMGRTVSRLYLMAHFDGIMGAEHMRNARADRKFYAGEQWTPDEVSTMMARR